MAESTLDATSVKAFTIHGNKSTTLSPTQTSNKLTELPPTPDSHEPTELPPTPDGGEPTEREKQTLRKVADKLPWSAFIICLVELCERFAFYGLVSPFQNYIENKHGVSGIPGALGLGQKAATGKLSPLIRLLRTSSDTR